MPFSSGVLSRPSAYIVPAILILATAGTLAGGYMLKAHCTDVPWDGAQFSDRCYSDIVPLFAGRDLDEGATPYLDQAEGPVDGPKGHPGFLEYPVLTGVVMWAAAQAALDGWLGAGPDAAGFLFWNALIMAPFALATTWLLYRMTDHPARVALFAVGPPLFLYAFHNWDLPAVFFLVLALERFEADRPMQSGIALGFGGAAKLFPLLAAPLLFLLLWRRVHDGRHRPHHALEDHVRSLVAARPAWRFAGGVLGALALVHVPLLLAGGGPLYLEMFRFHTGRGANPEAVWTALNGVTGFLSIPWDAEAVEAWAKPLFVLGFGGVAWWTWIQRPSARAAVFAALLVLLVTNTFFSLQYLLWLLPFFVLLPVPWWLFGAYAAADLAVFHTLFAHFEVGWATGYVEHYPRVAAAILFRAAVMLGLLGWTFRRAPRGMADQAPSSVGLVRGRGRRRAAFD